MNEFRFKNRLTTAQIVKTHHDFNSIDTFENHFVKTNENDFQLITNDEFYQLLKNDAIVTKKNDVDENCNFDCEIFNDSLDENLTNEKNTNMKKMKNVNLKKIIKNKTNDEMMTNQKNEKKLKKL